MSESVLLPISFEEKDKKLKESISDFENVKTDIKTGFEHYDIIKRQKRKILNLLNASEKDWNDYRWHLNNAFSNALHLRTILNLSEEHLRDIDTVGGRYRFLASPYYISIIDINNPICPIRRQCLPSIEELNDIGEYDPLNENNTTINRMISRRYPDRLILNITNRCGTFCRHCQRKRLIGHSDKNVSKRYFVKAMEYIETNIEIRDVLITGGDAFLVNDDQIEWILKELRRIRHVEIIRFGTRTPVTLPQRITKSLVKILKRHHPVYVNTQFNHPLEVTPESQKACDMLADAGIPLGNQMVLLNKVNNDKFIVRKLNHQLLKLRVKPYYIFHPYHVKGTSHFWITIQEGIDIMDSLRGFTSGMAVPYYVLNGPDGLGKTPVLPEYLLYMNEDMAIFRNWEGKLFETKNKKDIGI
ncbi:MAG: KamA family radical SAM protein [Bacillota bacterium]